MAGIIQVSVNPYEALKGQAIAMLMLDLKRAEERADTEGWIAADDLEKELGVLDICFSGQTA